MVEIWAFSDIKYGLLLVGVLERRKWQYLSLSVSTEINKYCHFQRLLRLLNNFQNQNYKPPLFFIWGPEHISPILHIFSVSFVFSFESKNKVLYQQVFFYKFTFRKIFLVYFEANNPSFVRDKIKRLNLVGPPCMQGCILLQQIIF